MAITVNNILSGVLDAGGTSITFTAYNVGAGTANTRKLGFAFQQESDDRVVTSATYGGTALTEADSVSVGAGAGYNYGTVWYIDDADIGVGSQTEDLVINISGLSTKSTAFAFWLDDVAQGAPTQTIVASDASAGLTSFGATINGVAANAIIINAFGLGDNVTPVDPDGTQTKMGELLVGTMTGAAAYEIPGAGNHTQGWDFPAARRPNIVLVEWAEFGGGGGSITAPTVQPIHAIGTNGNSFATFTGSYSGITPTLIEARVMRSAVEVIGWGSVDSFGAGVFDYTPSIPANDGYTIEVRTTVSAVLYSDTSDSFDVGPVLAIIGSSSAVRAFSVGTDTLTGISHVKSSNVWTEYDSTLETGSPWVGLANYLESKFSSPTGFYDYGVGGTELLVGWLPPSGTQYVAFTGDVEDGNISAIIDVAGSVDTRNGVTVTEANFTNFYSNLRSDTRDTPIIRITNQRFPGAGVDAQAVASWLASQDLADGDVDNYLVWRIDVEIDGDNVHNTVAGYDDVYLRVGSVFDDVFGSGTYNKGPSITAATITDTNEITLTLDDTDTDYTTITPTTGIAGFRVDGGVISITSADVVSGDIVLSLGSAPSAGDLVEFAAYDEDVPGTLAFTSYPLVNSENVMPIDPITTALVLTQSINLLPTLGLSKSNSLNPSVQISAPVELSPSTPRSISNSFDPSVILASLVDVSPSLVSSKSNALDPSVLIASSVSVAPAVSRSISNSLDPSMAIVANVEIIPSVDRSASNAANPDVQIGGDISVLPQASRSASNSLDPAISLTANVEVSPAAPLSASRPLDPSVQLSTPILVAPNSIRSISVANDPVIDIDETIVVFPGVDRSVSNALVPLVQVGQAVRIDEFTVNYRNQDVSLNYAGDYVAANYGD